MKSLYLLPRKDQTYKNIVWQSNEKIENRSEEEDLNSKENRINERLKEIEGKFLTKHRAKKIARLKEKLEKIQGEDVIQANTELEKDLQELDTETLKLSQEQLTESFVGQEGGRDIINGSLLSVAACQEAINKGTESLVKLPPADEKLIGLGDILPPEVGTVMVKEPNGTFKEAIRQGIAGGFYYPNGRYAKILNGGYEFKLTGSLRTQGELDDIREKFENKHTESFDNIEGDKELEVNGGEKVSEKKLVFEMAMRYGIDPHLLLTLRRQKKETSKADSTIDIINQINISARSIQNSMVLYENGFIKENPLNDDAFLSVEFLAFYADRELGGVTSNILPKIAKMYGEFIGKPAEYILNREKIKTLQEKVAGYGYLEDLNLNSEQYRFVDPESLADEDEVARMNVPAMGRLSSEFGMRYHPIDHTRKMHRGIDIANRQGTSIKAAQKGEITFAGRKGGYGNMIEITHTNPSAPVTQYVTRYAHLSSINVSAGTAVDQGETIGEMGSTGRSTGSHLHFELRKNGKPVNPENYFVG